MKHPSRRRTIGRTWLIGVTAAALSGSGFLVSVAANAAPGPASAPSTAAPGAGNSEGPDPYIRTIDLGASVNPTAPPAGSPIYTGKLPEIAPEPRPQEGGALAPSAARMAPPADSPATPVIDAADRRAPRSSGFTGLTMYDQRTANNGNQFSVEPPDQGLCAGNGLVLETVNDVLRVYDRRGGPQTGVIDLNTFYGYPAQVDRTPGAKAPYGPFLTDPTCHYDADTNRWFHVVLTLDQDPVSGDFTGTNHLDIAVSRTGDPTRGWNIYQLAVQDDGTQGTPDHSARCGDGPCIGDYPQVGADKNGFYISTNEYSLLADGYAGAQIYAFPKKSLARGDNRVTVVQFDTGLGQGYQLGDQPGFTVFPATTVKSADDTEFFLSSMAGDGSETGNTTGQASTLGVWAMTRTDTLDSRKPKVRLTNTIIDVDQYKMPDPAEQKTGPFPLGQLLDEPLAPLDSSDTRMGKVWYVDGRLYGSLGTGITSNGSNRTGAAWYQIRADMQGAKRIKASVQNQGVVAAAGNNLTYPVMALTSADNWAMGFTLVGPDNFPSHAFVRFADNRPGPIVVSGAGAGPQDGFTGYSVGGNRPRWGDYGGSATDGKDLYLAGEFIAQTCTLAEYKADATCGNTRVSLGNWATHVTRLPN